MSSSRHTADGDAVTAAVDALAQRTGYTYAAAADDGTETYDATGRLQKTVARNGWTTTLTYSDATTPTLIAPRPGLLISVKNHFGRELKFTYDAAGQIVELLPPGALSGQPAGSAVSPIRYIYNEGTSFGAGVIALGQLTSIVWQDGATRRYTYEDARWRKIITGLIDEAGVRYGTYAYDDQGRVTRSELSGGVERLDFVYGQDASGKPTTTVTDYTGAGGAATTRSYTFADIGGVRYPSSLTAPCSLCGSTAQATTYDADGNKTREVGHDGKVTFFKYDTKGRETERATFAASYATATTRPALNAAEKVTSTKWHATWNLPTQVAEPGKVTATTYSAKGNLTGESWTATTDATGAAKFAAVKTGSTFATGYGYNANSLLTSIVEKIDATTVAQMTYTVNAAGNATKATNPLTVQSTTSATYDAHGRLVGEVDSFGAITRAYTPRGFILQEKDETATTTVTHNAIGLVTEVNSGTGYIWSWTYKPNHRVQTVTLNGATIATYASTDPGKAPKSLIDLFITTAHAQTGGATLPGPPGGGLRAPGRLILVPLIWELGKRLKDSALPAEGTPDKDENCDLCKDPSKTPRWIPRDYKHLPPKGKAWSAVRASTANGGFAKYDPALVPNTVVQQAFELDVWARGKVIKNTNSEVYKVVRFGGPRVGAYGGADTQCAIVKCSASEIHGHPAAEAECNKPEVPYP